MALFVNSQSALNSTAEAEQSPGRPSRNTPMSLGIQGRHIFSLPALCWTHFEGGDSSVHI